MAVEAEEGLDYYIDSRGYFVMTEAEHLRRGECCGNHCKHCAYEYANVTSAFTNPGAIAYRKATSTDEAQVSAVVRQVSVASYSPLFTDARSQLVPLLMQSFNAEVITASLNNPSHHWLIAVDAKQRVLGATLLDISKSSIDYLVVRSQVRRQGIASYMLDSIVEFAQKAGLASIMTSVPDLPGTHKFLATNNFHLTNESEGGFASEVLRLKHYKMSLLASNA